MDNVREENHGDRSRELYAWFETFSFLKRKKNVSGTLAFRDFSDAVLLAEILKIYYPRYVDLHNYIPVSNIYMKKENWNTLNRKVLSKINMKLSKDTIQNLANAQQGDIEKLLRELKVKLTKDDQTNGKKDGELGKDQETQLEDINSIEFPAELSRVIDEIDRSMEPSVFSFAYFKLTIASILSWLVNWTSVWKFFHERNSTEEPRVDDSTVPPLLYAQVRQELREKDDLISALNHRLAYLENAMKQRDMRISNLTLRNTADFDRISKLQQQQQQQQQSQQQQQEMHNGVGQSKIRARFCHLSRQNDHETTQT